MTGIANLPGTFQVLQKTNRFLAGTTSCTTSSMSVPTWCRNLYRWFMLRSTTQWKMPLSMVAPIDKDIVLSGAWKTMDACWGRSSTLVARQSKKKCTTLVLSGCWTFGAKTLRAKAAGGSTWPDRQWQLQWLRMMSATSDANMPNCLALVVYLPAICSGNTSPSGRLGLQWLLHWSRKTHLFECPGRTKVLLAMLPQDDPRPVLLRHYQQVCAFVKHHAIPDRHSLEKPLKGLLPRMIACNLQACIDGVLYMFLRQLLTLAANHEVMQTPR